MNPTTYAIAGALISGALVAAQSPTNAALARGAGSPVNAAFISFAVGTTALALAVTALAYLAPGQRPQASSLRVLPLWTWLGGVYGAMFVSAITFAAPKIGVGAALTLSVAAQLGMAVAIDHFGWFGLPRRPMDLTRVIGVAMVFGGAFLVRRN